MERTALFPGSFDPFTKGHKSIVDQGLTMFDKIVVGIGANSDKRGLLTVENRVRLIYDIYKDNPSVIVASYDKLTGEFCREIGVRFVLRGMRNTVDYEYERGMAFVNQKLYPEITTVLLFTPPEYVQGRGPAQGLAVAHGGGHGKNRFGGQAAQNRSQGRIQPGHHDHHLVRIHFLYAAGQSPQPGHAAVFIYRMFDPHVFQGSGRLPGDEGVGGTG